MLRTTKKIIKGIEDNFSMINEVIVVDKEKAYECTEIDNLDEYLKDETENAKYTVTREWEEIEWKGDKVQSHEVALVIHDVESNIIGWDEEYRNNDVSWDKFTKQTKLVSEPYNCWKMGIYKEW